MIEIEHLNRLIDCGFSLICIGDGKKPNHPWKGNQTVPFSKEEFKFFYENPDTKGVGIATGYNNLEVIDIDLKILLSSIRPSTTDIISCTDVNR